MALLDTVRAVPRRTTTLVRVDRRGAALLTLVAWLVLFAWLKGRDTLRLEQSDVTGLHTWLNTVDDRVGDARQDNPAFRNVVGGIRDTIDAVATALQHLLSSPVGDRPLPLVGWLGVVTVATLGAWAVSGVRLALLTMLGLLFIGSQGLWQPSMDTVALTLTAVLFSLLVGIPLGIATGLSRRVRLVVTPLLDLAQILPAFVYLAPLALFFSIGPASATIATLVYAAPPVVRLTALGITEVPRATIESATSLGATRWQVLRTVQLPSARRTIVVGINQTVMAALAMVTIAALIDAPGLGRVVLDALNHLDIGTAFNGGLAIVVLAVVCDRVTTAARRPRTQVGGGPRVRLAVTVLATALGALAVYLSYTYLWAARFPASPDLGTPIEERTTTVVDWVQAHFGGATGWVKDEVTRGVLDPVQSLLVDSPWWLTAAALVALAAIVGSARAALTAAVCVGLIIGTGLWSDAMATLAATLLATAVVVVLGVVLGVWMGRSPRVDRTIRPVLDAAQVMPAFVYLVPFVALFAASRFTGIAAAVVFAAPVVLKIVADGIAGVPRAAVEAATAAGSSTWQTVTKVQLPMSLRTLVLATNQGLVYVLSMVVVGGLVGAGALGFDVVSGFRQEKWFGKGIAAGVAIVLLGVLLDRVLQAAAARAPQAPRERHRAP
ncbi:glycine betaine/proline transport system permease protein [Motilibacter peucedani]|uniref:Glycine betaine/proline transport system permease protein n=1 Tax=Motilibacter peucedani TaxID=598650 RepID=A0A420XRL1_9ACTN|nr:ABC transporter permease subunit [Motilibacter peucedani]RKS77518.1 glycine betaine/proline transport system permease protein [Motilibacter peucedani]